MGQYAELFATNAITPPAFVLLSDADLKEIGVVFGHRKIILHKIAVLNAVPPPTPESPGLPETIPPASLPENGGSVSRGPSTAPAAPQTKRPVASAPPSVQPLFAPPPGVPPPFVPATPVEMQPAAAPVPTPHAEPPPRKTFWAKLIASKFLFISIVAHLLFGLGATYFIVQRVQAKRKLTFRGGPPSPNPSKRALEHKVSMAKKKTGGAPPQAKRIVSAGISKVSLPEMPTMPTASSVMQGMAAGMGGVGSGQGFGAGGTGGGMGGGGGGGMTLFGFRGTGDGLKGTFYDFKQTQDRKPTKMKAGENEIVDPSIAVNIEYIKAIKHFTRNWNKSTLSGFYKAPENLVAYQLMIPELPADEAPKAFNVEKECAPRRWVVHYQARIVPPRDGRFRFRGRADDILMVRYNGSNVLDGNYSLYSVERNINTTSESDNAQLIGGKWIAMRKSVPADLEIIIGECPGGGFFARLCIEEDGVAYPDGYPVFQLKDVPIPENPGPSVSKKGIVFGVEPAKMGFSSFGR